MTNVKWPEREGMLTKDQLASISVN